VIYFLTASQYRRFLAAGFISNNRMPDGNTVTIVQPLPEGPMTTIHYDDGPELFSCPWCDVTPLPDEHNCDALGGFSVTRSEVERQNQYDLACDRANRWRGRIIPFLAAAAIFALGALVYMAPWAH
jgi:hypothetical protein